MKIELFVIAGCPNRQPAVDRIKEALEQLGIAGEVVEWPINNPGAASALRFLGSPTVRINGIDVEPSARTSNQFGFMCRTYLNGPWREGVLSRQLIYEAVLEACRQGDIETP